MTMENFDRENAAHVGRTNAMSAAICGVAGVDVPAYDAGTEVKVEDGIAAVTTDGSRRNAGSFVDSGRIYTRSGNYCRIEINAEEMATLTAIGDAGAAAGIAEFDSRQAPPVVESRTPAEMDAADGDMDGDNEPGSAPCEADEPGWSEDDPTRWRGSAAAAPTCGRDADCAARGFDSHTTARKAAQAISEYYYQRRLQREKLHKLSRVVAPRRVAEAQRKYDKGKAKRCSAYHLRNLKDAMAWQVAIDRRYAELVRQGNELDAINRRYAELVRRGNELD